MIPIEEIQEKIDRYYRDSNRQDPVHSNRASEIGHPCEKYLVLARTRWNEATPPDVGLIKIFGEGNIQEKAIVALLEKIGYRVYNANRDFPPNPLNITGHIDGQIYDEEKDKGVYFDAKTVTPFLFPGLKSVADFNKKYWMKKWIAQANIYMWMLGVEIFYFVLKNKSSGEIRILPCEFDRELTASLLRKAKRINRHIEEKTVPDGIKDYTICKGCKFYSICLPDAISAGAGTQLLNEDELEAAIKERNELTEAVHRHSALDKYIKGEMSSKNQGSYVIGKSYFVEVKEVKRAAYSVKASEYKTVKITEIPEVDPLKYIIDRFDEEI